MEKKRLVVGLVSLAVSLGLYLVDVTKTSFAATFESWGTNVNVYPAAFFALLGLFFLWRAYLKEQHA